MDAVICFNDGYVSRIKVFEALGIKPGYNTERALFIIDNKRIFEAERIVNKVSLEARNRRSLKRKMDKQNLDEENEYQAGNINQIYNIFGFRGTIVTYLGTKALHIAGTALEENDDPFE
ncbi:hypothetical protein TNCV_1731601 [Trichonephila clavipes]|nr:hypothetical protein TNCV_1731601 [Trichonephila clavipes]